MNLDLTKLTVPDAQLIQHGLNKLGYYSGTYLGKPGEQTLSAYQRYLADHYQTPSSPSTASLPWMNEARKWLGLKEIPGSKHNPQILEWWKRIKAPFVDDETAWCAGFVGGVLETVGIQSTRSAAARSYESWGKKLAKPCEGCVVVFWRGSKTGWQGHVAFVAGKASNGDLFCLGGNQSDGVNIARFDTARVLAYRWPSTGVYPQRDLKIVSGPTQLSTNEA